jgi:AcrR family transcriptional regulator
MGTADRIERERQAKRTAILDAARELFVERGVEAVTLREVAQKIEYSTTAIYVHFKDKQDLIEQMCNEDFSKFAGALLAMRDIADPVERLDKLGEAYVQFALSMPRHYTLLFLTPATTSVPPPEHEDPGFAGFALLLHTVEECIAQKRFRPEHTDANGLALAIWSFVHGLVSLLIVKGQHPRFHWKQPDEFLALGRGPMMRGLLADPDAYFSRHEPRARAPGRRSAAASADAPRAPTGGRASGSRGPKRRGS